VISPVDPAMGERACASTSMEVSHGINSDYRRSHGAIRRRRLLGSRSGLLVNKRVPAHERVQGRSKPSTIESPKPHFTSRLFVASFWQASVRHETATEV
jgi:hypothetical protein